MSTESSQDNFEERAAQYALQKSLALTSQKYGRVLHGLVFEAISQSHCGSSALKAFERLDAYIRERNVYLRLRYHGVLQVPDSLNTAT